jgi:hypothetical protein
MNMAGIEMTHVPYKGNARALTDVIAGHIPLMFSDTASLPMIQAGEVRALGVSSALRLPSAPDIPPLAEGGLPEFDVAGWAMIIAPAGTPDEVASKVHMTFRAVEALPEVQQQVIKLGMLPGNSPPRDQLLAFISTEIERWRKVVIQGRACRLPTLIDPRCLSCAAANGRWNAWQQSFGRAAAGRDITLPNRIRAMPPQAISISSPPLRQPFPISSPRSR